MMVRVVLVTVPKPFKIPSSQISSPNCPEEKSKQWINEVVDAP